MKTDQSNDASVIAVIGATGSGKGVYIKNYALRNPVDKRLVVWDYMREYAPLVNTSSDRLSDTIRGMGAKAFVALCDKLAATYGPRFEPPQLLRDMAAAGETFYGRAAAKKAA